LLVAQGTWCSAARRGEWRRLAETAAGGDCRSSLHEAG
jgi:hypothetical protein